MNGKNVRNGMRERERERERESRGDSQTDTFSKLNIRI